MARRSDCNKYPCGDCIRVFPSWLDLMDHFRKEHEDNPAVGDATDSAAQEISHEAEDLTNAAAQEISSQKDLRYRDKNMKKNKEYIQGVTADNLKDIDQIVREIDQTGKEKPKKCGAGGKRGAKVQNYVKSSKKPNKEAENKTTPEGTSVELGGQEQEVAEDNSKVEEKEDAEKEGDVSYILLEAMKKAYQRYLEASSASKDKSARSLEELEKLASHLSCLCAGSASEDSSLLILKIAKSGIDYAFTDIHRYECFLTSAVLKYASVLPRASFTEVFNYLVDQSSKATTLEICQGPRLMFEETLLQKMQEKKSVDEDSSSEEEDEPSSGGGNQIEWEPEKEAYSYFSLRNRNVTWVNELQESGQPFDITVEASDGKLEFVEVTATLPDQVWFRLSLNVLKFSLEKGAAYSIAHVSKSDNGVFKMIAYKDIEKHLKSRKLKLVVYPTEDKSKVYEKAVAENELVYDILLAAMIKVYLRYQASSASKDECARSLEELASNLASLCAGFDPLILKIVKAGIDFAFTDIHLHQSFLTSAVLTFASVLPEAPFSEVFKYLKDQTRKVVTLVGPYVCGPQEKAGSILIQKRRLEGKDLFEAQDEPSANKIGWEGEKEVYRRFSRLGYKHVKWVNQVRESGQPFDIILEASDGTVEFLEVKTTSLPNREWFHLSVNELKCALEKGAAYSIVHVCKSVGVFKMIRYENIEKQLRSKKLKLALYPTGR